MITSSPIPIRPRVLPLTPALSPSEGARESGAPAPNPASGIQHPASSPQHPASSIQHPASSIPRQSAFTLIEILVTISLLAFIILGLYGMFTQVQRAFRQSMTQVDLLEAGRAVTAMLPRELEQITPSGHLYPNGVNFYFQCPAYSYSPPYAGTAPSAPLSSPLAGTAAQRINVLQDCFMLLRQNQTWVGIGYCVRVSDPTDPTGRRLILPEAGAGQMAVGSLYRYSITLPAIYNDPTTKNYQNGLPNDATVLYRAFRNACVPGSVASANISNRICDGVIHFCFRAFATNGFPIFSYGSQNRAYFRTNFVGNPPAYPYFGAIKQALTVPNTFHPTVYYPDNLTGLYFYSNAVPAAVELELGILDQHSWERYNSIGAPAARLAYLQRPEVTSRIQLFRQRIPIRNVDPLAYQ